MKLTLLLIALCLALGLVSAVRNHSDKRHILINRPKIDVFGPREKRAAAPWPLERAASVKGGVKGYRPVPATHTVAELNLRKGEYVCGNKICKLKPGVEPEGCDGICQYPL